MIIIYNFFNLLVNDNSYSFKRIRTPITEAVNIYTSHTRALIFSYIYISYILYTYGSVRYHIIRYILHRLIHMTIPKI
jgi:hypothetical protein